MEDTAIGVGAAGAESGVPVGTDRSTGGGAQDISVPVDLAAEPGHLAELPRSLAEVTSSRGENVVEHRLQLSPGATAAEVTAAMILMPPAASLAGPRAGAPTVLVFHESTRGPAPVAG
jgi:uncharacterized repeat protein (TIGR03917 family)